MARACSPQAPRETSQGPQYFDLRTHDWLELLSTKLMVEGLTVADLPDADESDFLLVVEELGFTNALHRMKLRKAVRQLQAAASPEGGDKSPQRSPQSRRRSSSSPHKRSSSRIRSGMSCDLQTVKEDSDGSPEDDLQSSSLPACRPVSGTGGTTEPVVSPARTVSAPVSPSGSSAPAPQASSVSAPQAAALSILTARQLEEPDTQPSTPRFSPIISEAHLAEKELSGMRSARPSRDLDPPEELVRPVNTSSTIYSGRGGLIPSCTSASATNLHDPALGASSPRLSATRPVMEVIPDRPTFLSRSKSLSPIRMNTPGPVSAQVRPARKVVVPQAAAGAPPRSYVFPLGIAGARVPMSSVVVPATMVVNHRKPAAPAASSAQAMSAVPSMMQVRVMSHKRPGSVCVEARRVNL